MFEAILRRALKMSLECGSKIELFYYVIFAMHEGHYVEKQKQQPRKKVYLCVPILNDAQAENAHQCVLILNQSI